jgi:hypothetical protein
LSLTPVEGRFVSEITRAISIRQPLVEQILRGEKGFEYRSMNTKIRERVYLYASAKPFDSPELWRKMKVQPGDLPTGVIVGSVEITDSAWDQENDSYAYTLAKPKRLRSHLTAINQPQPVFWRPRFR